MSDFLFSIAGRNPNFIIGKWDANNLSPVTREIYGDFFSKELGQLQINKYEFWFNDTISFIPYNGQPVFIADTLGNVTHTGNLTTKKNVTIEENLTVKKLVTVDDNATFKKDVKVDGKLEVTSDIRTTGNIFAANLASLFTAASSIGDIQKSIDDIKKQIDELKQSQKSD